MKYRATTDSYTNHFYYRDRVYDFPDKAPNSHFECLDVPQQKSEVVTEDSAAEKQELLDMADEKGIEVDKRWGVKRIREALEQEG